MAADYRPELTAEEAAGDADLRGKTVVITGASAGLGVETARVLASRGARIVAAVRDLEKGRRAADLIRQTVPDANIEFAELDLFDLASVRTGADDIAARCPRIDLLINNAAVAGHPMKRTEEGLDIHLGTNNLGHFVLTARLIERVLAAAPARIVNVASAGHQVSPFRFDDPFFESRDFDILTAYGQSKLANVHFTVALNRRFGDRGVRAFALHPGVIMDTELARHMTAEDLHSVDLGFEGIKSVPQGAASTVWAAVAPELDEASGVYIEDSAVADVVESTDTPGQTQGVMAYALDEEAAERLWTLSGEWSGEAFPA